MVRVKVRVKGRVNMRVRVRVRVSAFRVRVSLHKWCAHPQE